MGEDLIPLVPIAKLQQGRPGGQRSKATIETALHEPEDASRARPVMVVEGRRIVTFATLIRKRETGKSENLLMIILLELLTMGGQGMNH